ncbi:MAG: ferredoxin family protein [Dehalococcoidales bacterium]|nr:ferredoxin family protein [Dehalococcoidales bacterium]
MIKVTYGPSIDYENCNGCGKCYDICPMDVYGWDEEKHLPVVNYPEECRACLYCEFGCSCVAIDVRFPLHAMLDFGIDPRKV